MQTIILQPLLHRGAEQMALQYKDGALNKVVKKIKGVRWSQTHKCWYLPLSQASHTLVTTHLKDKAKLNSEELRVWLQKKNAVAVTLPISKPIVKPKSLALNKAFNLCPKNLEALGSLVQQLTLKAYSQSTINTYRNEFMQLLQLLKEKDAATLTVEDIKRYMVYAMEQQGISENTAHSRLNALKFYYEQVLGREKFFWEIPRPKKPMQLPKLLNENEIRKLFNALTNKKHKAMLFTAYSAGLRVSEIVNLQIADIDSQRMQIRIANAKGKKDRYVNLSPVLLDILRKYVGEYKPGPKVYLFESESTLCAYATRTVQQVFSTAKLRAGILKQVGIHSLRHSFATHLLDKGTDIKYIKDLLGHFNIKTTERYLHVSNKQLVNIISPFDDLVAQGNIDW